MVTIDGKEDFGSPNTIGAHDLTTLKIEDLQEQPRKKLENNPVWNLKVTDDKN